VTSTLNDLLAERTAKDEESSLLSVLKDKGFPVTDWRAGGAGETLVKAIAERLAVLDRQVPAATAAGFVALAKGAWLELLAENYYGLIPAQPTFTRQRCLLRCAPGLGPLQVSQGLIVRASGGHHYVYREPETIEVPDDNSQVPVEVEAQEPGSAYADAANTITEVVTPLPGLEVANPHLAFDVDGPALVIAPSSAMGSGAVVPTTTTAGQVPAFSREYAVAVGTTGNAGTDGTVSVGYRQGAAFVLVGTFSPIPLTLDVGDGVRIAFQNGVGSPPAFTAGAVYVFRTRVAPIVRQGADAESDSSLGGRCRGRWSSLGQNLTSGAVENLVRTASIELKLGISRIVVQPSATVAGQTVATIATASGDPGAQTTQQLQTVLSRQVAGGTESVMVRGARNVEVAAAGTVVVPAGSLAAVQRAADRTWATYLAELPIGGDRSTGYPGVVRLAELSQALMDAGAVDVSGLTVNGAAVNLVLAGDEAPVVAAPLALGLSWTPI
jgi:hypothetical protein